MPVTTIACEFCGAPLRVMRERQYRLKYHPACKRTVDRERARARRNATGSTEHVCDWCGADVHREAQGREIPLAALPHGSAPRQGAARRQSLRQA
jgi:hypothetical protein